MRAFSKIITLKDDFITSELSKNNGKPYSLLEDELNSLLEKYNVHSYNFTSLYSGFPYSTPGFVLTAIISDK